MATRLMDLVQLFRWELLGYGLCRAWIIAHIECVRIATGDGGYAAVICLSAALVLSAAACIALFDRPRTARTGPVAALVAGLMGTSCVALGCLSDSTAYLLAGSALVGAGGAYFEIGWGLRLAACPRDGAYVNILTAVLCASLVGLPLSASVTSPFFFVLSTATLLGIAATYVRAAGSERAAGSSHAQTQRPGPANKRRLLAGLVVCCFFYFLVHSCANTLGYESIAPVNAYNIRLASNLLTALVLLGACTAFGPITTPGFVKAILPLTVLGLLCQLIDFEGLANVALAALCCGNKLFEIFILLMVVELVQSGSIAAEKGFGIAVVLKNLALCLGTAISGAALSLASRGMLDVTVFVATLVMMLIVVLVWPLSESLAPASADRTGNALQPGPADGPGMATLATCAAALAEERGLTPRESELLLLACRGKNRASISRELGISPNTVHIHTVRIYQKVGVHDQQELIALVEKRMHAEDDA